MTMRVPGSSTRDYQRALFRSLEIAALAALVGSHLTSRVEYVAAGAIVTAAAGFLSLRWVAGRRVEGRRWTEADDATMRALLHSTLESTTDGILTVALDGRVVSYNQRFLEMWGLEEDEAMDHGRRMAAAVRQLVDPEGFLRRIEALGSGEDAGSSDTVEFLDGRVLQRTSLPHRLNGRTIGRVWSFRDITEQVRAESALAESERRFRRMATNVPGVIFQFYVRRDNTLWYTYLSEGSQELLGVQPTTTPWRADILIERVHPDDMAVMRAAVIRSAERMEPWTWEGRVRVPSGVTRWLRTASRPTRHADGKITWDGLLMDVTEEKNAVEALHRREEQLAEAQQMAHIGSWDWNLADGRVTASAEHWRIFGYEPDAFSWTMDDYLAAVHPADRDKVQAQIRCIVDRGTESSVDFRIVRPDGVERYVTARGKVVHDRDGKPTRIVGTVQDITSRLKAEEALRESEERFRQMAESMREVFFMVSVDSREVIYLSPSYEEVWGRPRSETAAFVESILPEDRHILFEDMALSEAGEGDPLRFIDYRISRPDGSIRWIRHRTFQVLDAEGNPYRVTGVCSDITEQKQLEEELRRANRIEAIGHLAAGVAHEINTPIQYIGDNVRFLDDCYGDVRRAVEAYRQLAEEAASGTLDPKRIAEVLAVAEEADLQYLLDEAPHASAQALDGVQRVAEIVRAMKEFSHPGSGHKVPTDLNQAIRSTITVARNEWKYIADLLTEFDDSLPMVSCLPGELNQAILNVVVNAAHAIADRQQSEGSETRGVILVATERVGDLVEIRVSDTGAGIPEQIRGRVFDPFFTTKEVGRGTGQGLTFVHSIIVEKHGGTVSFESEVGIGTTFILRLPQGAPTSSLEEAA